MSINRNFMNDRVRRMWKTQDRLEVIDLGKDVFLFKFNNTEDLERALYGGPWFIMNHYLMLTRWKPDFRPSESGFDKISIWIRFPEFPMEYYDKEALFTIAEKVGRPIKVDYATDNAARGRYARVCIEVDLAVPLVTKVWVGKAWQAVEYENLSLVCFECGKIGHRRDICKTRENTKVQEDGRRQKGKAAMMESTENSSYQATKIVADPSRSVGNRAIGDEDQWKGLDVSLKDTVSGVEQEKYGSWIFVTSGRKNNNSVKEVRKGMGRYNQEKSRVLKGKNLKEGSGVRGSGEIEIVNINKWENLNRAGEDKDINEEIERSNDDISGINKKFPEEKQEVAGFFGSNKIAAERIGEKKSGVFSPKDNNLHGKATSIPLPIVLNSQESTIKKPIFSSSSFPLHGSYGEKPLNQAMPLALHATQGHLKKSPMKPSRFLTPVPPLLTQSLFPTFPTPLVWKFLANPSTQEKSLELHFHLRHLMMYQHHRISEPWIFDFGPEPRLQAPRKNLPVFLLKSESQEVEISKPQNLMSVVILEAMIDLFQVELEFYRTPASPPEIWALMISVKVNMEEVGVGSGVLPPKKRLRQEETISENERGNFRRPLRMKAVIWNVRGANSKNFLWHALEMVKVQKPDIFIILETKCSSLRADQGTDRLGFRNFRIIPSFGKRGCIWLLWKNDITLVQYADYKPNHFHALFKLSPNTPEVLITGMHAPSVATDRKKY